MLSISGEQAAQFRAEGGGHRWQRVPPTERRGRVHTSTVTVAVIEPIADSASVLRTEDVEITTTKNSGPGGQHRNKTESAVIALHRPTGERVRIATARSQHENKATALAVLAAKIAARQRDATMSKINSLRRNQIGSGERGDKIRTYRTQDDRIVDHRTGQTWRLSRWMRGEAC